MSIRKRSCPQCQAGQPDAARPVLTRGTCTHCGRDLAAVDPQSTVPGKSSTGKRRGRTAAVAAALLAILGAAGYSIVGSLGEVGWIPGAARGADAKPAVAQAPVVPELTDPSERCELQVFRDQPDGRTILVLTAPGKMTTFIPGTFGHHSRLARELARQAVLIAARDGLNVTVRDAVIGDTPPAGPPADVFDVDVLCPDDRVKLVIRHGPADRRTVVLEKTLRSTNVLPDYPAVAKVAEALAREGLPEALAGAGIARRPAPEPKDGDLPDGVEERLRRMSFAEQFAALRQLHAAVRSDGPSPRRLEGLARGYANLGLLTEYQWDASARAYKARGLLYAERLVATAPQSPHALWHRAYASALAGVHVQAIEDLAAARTLIDALPEADRPSAPGWVALLDAYCRYAVDELAKARGRSDSELGALLHLLTLEQPPRTDVALRAARSAIEANFECFRAHHALCEVGGVANLHTATTLAPDVLTSRVPARIAGLPGLPESVRETVQDEPDEVAMTRALVVASDPARDPIEPSWAALATIVRETRFAFTYRRLEFMAKNWSVPTGEYWQEVRPLVAEHRFRPFLETYVTGTNTPGFRAFAESVDTTDLGLTSLPMGQALGAVNPPVALPFYAIGQSLSDWVAGDLSGYATSYAQERGADFGRKILMVSPRSPHGRALLIGHAWAEVEPRIGEWQSQVGDHPTFLGAMARHHVKLDHPEEAEPALKRYIEQSPDLWAFRSLADLYRKKGDEDRWKKTLDDFLARIEDHGLDHAQVRVEIANDLMRRGQFAKARPYADAAAATWAGWAMTCAQRCAEGLEDWEAAEGWARASTERYPRTMWAVWFLLCERTGHGDVAAARAHTQAYAKRLVRQPDLPTDSLFLVAYVHLICGDREQAAAALRRIPADLDDPISITGLASASDLAGEVRLRDDALERFCANFANKAPKSTQVLQQIREALSKGPAEKPDMTAIDAILETIPRENRGNTAFPVAARLTALGRADEAAPYWHLSAEAEGTNYWWRVMARSFLRSRAPQAPGAGNGGKNGEPRQEL